MASWWLNHNFAQKSLVNTNCWEMHWVPVAKVATCWLSSFWFSSSEYVRKFCNLTRDSDKSLTSKTFSRVFQECPMIFGWLAHDCSQRYSEQAERPHEQVAFKTALWLGKRTCLSCGPYNVGAIPAHCSLNWENVLQILHDLFMTVVRDLAELVIFASWDDAQLPSSRLWKTFANSSHGTDMTDPWGKWIVIIHWQNTNEIMHFF